MPLHTLTFGLGSGKLYAEGEAIHTENTPGFAPKDVCNWVSQRQLGWARYYSASARSVPSMTNAAPPKGLWIMRPWIGLHDGKFTTYTVGQPAGSGICCRSGTVANVGVAVRQGVSSHGLFINVNPRMDTIALVRSQDDDRSRFPRASSLAAERGIPVAMPAVRESLIRRLAARLDYDRYHLYTGHPLLRRTRRAVAYA